jgi:hypothetical protein
MMLKVSGALQSVQTLMRAGPQRTRREDDNVHNRRLDKSVVDEMARHAQDIVLGLARELGPQRAEDLAGDVTNAKRHVPSRGVHRLEEAVRRLAKPHQIWEKKTSISLKSSTFEQEFSSRFMKIAFVSGSETA